MFIPKENDRNYLHTLETEVYPVLNITEVTNDIFKNEITEKGNIFTKTTDTVLTAEGIN